MAELTGDKTHDPTPHRRQLAREQGHVARSQELTSALMLLGGVAALFWFGRALVDFIGFCAVRHLGGEPWLATDTAFIVRTANGLMASLARVLLPVVGMLALVGIGANLVQTGVIFRPDRTLPDLSRLNPAEGFARLFSMKNLARVIFGVCKLAAVAAVAAYSLYAQRSEILNCGQLPPSALAAFMGETLIWTALEIAVALLALSALDYGWQRLQYERDLRMTTGELREEMRNLRGDPQWIARRRSLARQLREPRVAQAKVVITGPGELAVAIRYEAGAAAPVVVAKGRGSPGERIRESAIEHRVPVVEQTALAQSLYDAVDMKKTVPPQLFPAVAEILARIPPA
jgi:flagellar biosynthetic protein FlhB